MTDIFDRLSELEGFGDNKENSESFPEIGKYYIEKFLSIMNQKQKDLFMVELEKIGIEHEPVKKRPHMFYDENVSYLLKELDIDKKNWKYFLMIADRGYINNFEKILDSCKSVGFNFSDIFCSIFSVKNHDFYNIFSSNNDFFKNGLINISITNSKKFAPELGFLVKKIIYNKYEKKEDMFYVLFDKLEKPDLNLDNFPYLKKDIPILINSIKHNNPEDSGMNYLFRGMVGTGKTELAKLIAYSSGKEPWVIGSKGDTFGDNSDNYDRFEGFKFAISFLRKKRNIVFIIDEADDLIGDSDLSGNKDTTSKLYINDVLTNNKIPTIWICNSIRNIKDSFLRRMIYIVKFSIPEYKTRITIWESILKKYNLKIESDMLDDLAYKYEIPPSVIDNAVKLISLGKIDVSNIEVALTGSVKALSFNKNGSKNNTLNFDENVINTSFPVQKIYQSVKEEHKWSLCLYGETGTGKTEYAKALAHKIDREIMCLTATDLMSPFFGETEKNIRSTFEKAEEDNKILFLDEAEALLASRDNQDSFRRSFVNQFLSDLDTYKNPTIITTNHLHVLDKAILRRFLLKVEFKSLSIEQAQYAFKKFFGFDYLDRAYFSDLHVSDFASVKKQIEMGLQENNIDNILKLLNEEKKFRTDNNTQFSGFFMNKNQ